MDNINEFLTTVVFPALLTIITTVISLVAAIGERRRGKKDEAEKEKAEEKTKKDIVNTCVKAVEQMHKDVHGEEKFNLCVEGIKEMLFVKGIEASDFEIKMLVESSLAELNKAFEQPKQNCGLSDVDLSECAGGACPIYLDPEDVNEVD